MTETAGRWVPVYTGRPYHLCRLRDHVWERVSRPAYERICRRCARAERYVASAEVGGDE